MGEWISAEDRLPPWGYCLTYRPDAPSDNQIATVQYNPHYKGFSGGFLVTHWMPLPDPTEPHQGRGGGE